MPSFTVGTVKVAEVAPALRTTVLTRSWPAATKSWPGGSVTSTLTVRRAAGAGSAFTVKLAAAPSVTAAPAVTLISGSWGPVAAVSSSSTLIGRPMLSAFAPP